MLAPNGKISNLSDEQWRIVRTAGFKREFGDWEIVARAEAIMRLLPIDVDIRNYSKDQLFQIYKVLPNVMKDDESIIFFHSAFKKTYKENGLFALLVPQLNVILEKSVFLYSTPDSMAGLARPDGTIHKSHPNIIEYSNYIGKAKVGNSIYYVNFTVAKQKEQCGTHSFFVTNIALYEPLGFVATDNYSDESDQQWLHSEENASTPAPTRARLVFDRKVDTKLRDFFDLANEISEKIKDKLDSNGEPLPQYINEK